MTSKQVALSTASIAAMSLAQLQTLHSEMAATADDLGFKIPDNLLVEFETQEAGSMICDELNAKIEAFRAGIDEGDSKEPSSASGQKPLAPEGNKEDSAPVPKAPKKPKNSSASKVPASTTPKADKAPAQPKEASVATAKKAPAKKAAKKAAKKTASKAAPKNAASGDSKPRAKFDENHKVTFLPAENPCRAGSARFDRYELLRKGNGKTVKTLLGQGVPSATLANAVAKKIIKIG